MDSARAALVGHEEAGGGGASGEVWGCGGGRASRRRIWTASSKAVGLGEPPAAMVAS